MVSPDLNYPVAFSPGEPGVLKIRAKELRLALHTVIDHMPNLGLRRGDAKLAFVPEEPDTDRYRGNFYLQPTLSFRATPDSLAEIARATATTFVEIDRARAHGASLAAIRNGSLNFKEY